MHKWTNTRGETVLIVKHHDDEFANYYTVYVNDVRFASFYQEQLDTDWEVDIDGPVSIAFRTRVAARNYVLDKAGVHV